MTFRDTEKARYKSIKNELFSKEACEPGIYRGKKRIFCLADGYCCENLDAGIRDEAIAYFRERRIPWHDGQLDRQGHGRGLPSNHLCSSQVACVNTLWPLVHDAELLKRVFQPFLPDMNAPLPFEADRLSPDSKSSWLAFEWIGTRNYLGEKSWGTRGANATSADFAFRFQRNDGRVQLVLGEWKYTEQYGKKPMTPEAVNKTRHRTYYDAFQRWRQLVPQIPDYHVFFAEPFYQLMRQTLLAQEMERSAVEGSAEMEAEVVSVLHIAPKANREFSDNLAAAPSMASLGATVCTAWSCLAPSGRFQSIASEDLYAAIHEAAPENLRQWRDWLHRRYGW